MRVLIDIGHPAHVHLFRYTSEELKRHGHQVFFSVRDIPIAKRLMDCYGMEYYDLGKKKDTIFGKGLTVVCQDVKLLWFVWKNRIDIGLSSGIVLSHVSKLSKMKSFIFDDDDDFCEQLVVKYGHKYSDVVFTPSPIKRATPHAVYYDGCHELAYLHPNYFRPDIKVLEKANISPNERYFVLRFVAFKAHHDAQAHGMSLEHKRKIIGLLTRYGRVFITSEREIEPEFEQYRLPVPPEDIHSLMYYSTLFIGDSQTMISEAAVMGVPALKFSTGAGLIAVPRELAQKYKLCFEFQTNEFTQFYQQVEKLLDIPNMKEIWIERREKFLREKIDPTAFFVWFIENYPKSMDIIRDDSNYQQRFK